jgi:hypothetical protein
MTAAAIVHISSRAPAPSALQVFQLRAWARAYLAYACEITLADAVDVLQIDAVHSGLVDQIGQDEVQQILADSFGKMRS